MVKPDVLHTDVVIVGAGPVGLFAVFELGLLGIRAHLVDNLDRPGGQCSALYPEKPIYDIPGIPKVTGQELVDNLMIQIRPFKPTFHLNQEVCSIRRISGNMWSVKTNQRTEINCTCVVIATGNGVFTPKKMLVEEQEQFLDKTLFYKMPKIQELKDKKVAIAGGGDSALDWILTLSEELEHLSLIHRRNKFRGFPNSVAKVEELIQKGAVRLVVGQISSLKGENGLLSGVHVRGENRDTYLEIDVLCVFYGMDVRQQINFDIKTDDGRIPVNTHSFETSEGGLFAIGDANSYPGKLKLILSGFHEAALMSRRAFSYVFPDKKFRLEYTTASSTLKKRLGVTE